MKHTLLAGMLGVSVLTAFGSPADVEPEWIKIHERSAALGMYSCAAEGAVVTFGEQFCMITIGSKAEAADEVTLPWTDSGEWSIADKGLLRVTAPLLKDPVFFALVRWGEKEGLLRLESAKGIPPARMSRETFDRMHYRREDKVEHVREPSSASVTHPADAGTVASPATAQC